MKKRKHIRLPYYDYSKTGAYFITICTRDKKCVLSKIIYDSKNVGHDALIVPRVKLSAIGKVVEEHIKRIPGIDSYVIMPNHIHLIIIKSDEHIGKVWAPCPTSVSEDIRSFKTIVTKRLGFSVFQPRFYDHIIRNNADYISHLQYIEDNPQKWALGKDKYYE